MSMVSEFKTFVSQGNVVDLAVGVLLGGAFGKVVEGFSKGIVEPIIGLMGQPGVGFKVGVMDIGMVITAAINFIITAGILFFVFVKPMNAMKERAARRKEASDAAIK